MIIVADGSHWRTVDVAQLQAANVGGLMWKCTEGATYVDQDYAMVRDACQLWGMPFIAMHYVHHGSSVPDEVANIVRNVDVRTPLVLDVEQGSGDIWRLRDLYGRLLSAGYHVPFLYLPHWYWQVIGQPDLNGLPPLWASNYGSNQPGNPNDLYKQVKVSWWDGYGGNAPVLLQFTSNGQLPGMSLGDYSLFNGDSAQFRRYLDFNNFSYVTTMEDNDPMLIPKGSSVSYPVAIPSTKNVSLCLAPGNSDVHVEHIYTWGPGGGTGYDAHADVVVKSGAVFPLPIGTVKADLIATADDDYSVVLDVA